MAPPHAQTAWGSRGERVWVAELAVYCNYFSKKKKKGHILGKPYRQRGQLDYYKCLRQ